MATNSNIAPASASSDDQSGDCLKAFRFLFKIKIPEISAMIFTAYFEDYMAVPLRTQCPLLPILQEESTKSEKNAKLYANALAGWNAIQDLTFVLDDDNAAMELNKMTRQERLAIKHLVVVTGISLGGHKVTCSSNFQSIRLCVKKNFFRGDFELYKHDDDHIQSIDMMLQALVPPSLPSLNDDHIQSIDMMLQALVPPSLPSLKEVVIENLDCSGTSDFTWRDSKSATLVDRRLGAERTSKIVQRRLNSEGYLLSVSDRPLLSRQRPLYKEVCTWTAPFEVLKKTGELRVGNTGKSSPLL